jgi:nucleotide-binding universal stress UspA family protein
VRPPIIAAYSPKSRDRGPVDFALEAARATGAPVVVVAVGEDEPGAADRVREALTLDAGVELGTVGHGSPAKVLEAAIEELRPRLVVVGSTHRGRLGRVLPGSTAEQVMHGCSAPIAIVPHRHEMPQGGVRAIGAGFVSTDEGRAALRSAADLARALGARLLAVMVLSPHHADDQGAELLVGASHQDPGQSRQARARLVAQDVLEAAIAELAQGVETEPDVLYQDTLEGLEAASQRVDLMVIGARAGGALNVVGLGSVSRRLMVTAACPVLLLPRGVDRLLGVDAPEDAPAHNAG